MKTFLLVVIIMVPAVLLTIVIYKGIIKYCNMCVILKYNPIGFSECCSAFGCPMIVLLSGMFASMLKEAGSGLFISVLAAVITIVGLITGGILCCYSLKRIHMISGSWGFAIASYLVQIITTYFGMVTIGLATLLVYVGFKSITDRHDDDKKYYPM